MMLEFVDIVGWLAALLCMLISAAMLNDTYFGPVQRVDFGVAIGSFLSTVMHRNWDRFNQPAVRASVRYALRVIALVGVFADSGMVVSMPFTGIALTASRYEVGLRVALAIFLALQAPCPLWRYLLIGHPPRGTRNVQ